MQRILIRCLVWLSLISIGVPPGRVLAQEQPASSFALTGATLHTITHGVIPNGTLIIRDGKLAAVGPLPDVSIPDDTVIHDVSGKVILPGLVDTHSHLGVSSRPRVPANADTNETTGPVQSRVRALDAIYPSDPGIRMAQAGGITTANIMPGSGNVVGGQTAYVKLRGRTIEDMLIHKEGVQGGMKMANGENPKRIYGARQQAPSTRMGVAALQRQLFVQAQNYQKEWTLYHEQKEKDGKATPPDPNIGLDPVIEILEGKRVVHFHTHRSDDIMTAIRLAEEFQFRLVLQHVSEGYKVADEIARRNIPCSIIVLDAPGGKPEAVEMALRNAAVLEQSGVKVAFHTDDPITDSRFFLRTAALAVRAGMSEHGALRALTIDAAEMLDLQDRVGSLEVGKDADLVILSGPPFSVYSQVLETYIEGEKVFDRSRSEDIRYATGGFAVRDRYPGQGETE